MLIDFKQVQIAQFRQLVEKLMQAPAEYLNFATVADFYQAEWLQDLPKAATYLVSGLDDGAECFEIKISLDTHVLRLSYATDMQAVYDIAEQRLCSVYMDLSKMSDG